MNWCSVNVFLHSFSKKEKASEQVNLQVNVTDVSKKILDELL